LERIKKMASSEPRSFNKLVIDTIKKNDLKVIFEILMIMPNNRTIEDLNTLINIVLNVHILSFRLNPSNK
jgi:hypothetical protein